MKSKLNLILLSLAVLALSSCGGESNNVTSSGSASTVSVTTDGTTTTGTSSNNFTTIDQVRTAFNSMSLESGVTEGTFIYHIGSDYSSGNTSNTNVNISGCFFGLFGDCDSSSSNNNINSQLESYLDNGRMLQVGSLDSDRSTLNLNEATGVSNNNFIYDSYVYSRISADYQEMLGLDRSYMQTKLSSATVTLTDNTTFDAVVVEYVQGVFTTVSSIKSYVISTNLPVAANPIALVEGTYNYGTNVKKILKNVGANIQIKSIQFDTITAISRDNELVEIQGANITVN